MTTKSIVLPPPFTISKNIPQPQAMPLERNYPGKNRYPANLEFLVKKLNSEKSHGHEARFVSAVNTRKDLGELDVILYPDLFIAKVRNFYNACFRFIADHN